MRPYLSLLSARSRTLLQYRAAAFAGAGTQLFWGLIRVMVFDGFYRSAVGHQPMTFRQIVDYVWLSQAMFAMVPFTLDRDLRDLIRGGGVAYELLRPVDLYTYWLSRAAATRTAPTLLRAAPVVVIAYAFFGLRPPVSLEAGLAWIAAMIGALLLSCAISVFVSITMLWTVSGDGVAMLVPSLVMGLCGILVPIPLMPDWAQAVVNVLPFGGLVDFPLRLYTGSMVVSRLPWVLTHQVIWSAVFIVAGRAILAHGLRRLVVQGG